MRDDVNRYEKLIVWIMFVFNLKFRSSALNTPKRNLKKWTKQKFSQSILLTIKSIPLKAKKWIQMNNIPKMFHENGLIQSPVYFVES